MGGFFVSKQKNKYLLFASLTAASVMAVAPGVSAAELSFEDVSSNYKDAVDLLVGSNITEGMTETTFGTDAHIKRVDAAVLMAKTLGFTEDGNYKKSNFKDVPKRAEWAVNALVEAKIVNGKNSTTFGSDDQLTRNEAAVLIANATKLSVDTEIKKTNFTDVNSKFAPFVQALIDENITVGKTSTTYGAYDPIKRGEFAVFIHRAKELFGFLDLMVMHMNDTHSYLENYPYATTAIKETRKAHKNNLLLHGGDIFSGDLYFNAFEGEADTALMNYMGFDAMAFGNHEFDLGGSENGHKSLATFIENAKFPFLAANVDFSEDDLFEGLQSRSIASDYNNGHIYDGIVKEINGEKVGIFGLTTEETPTISTTDKVKFENYIEKAQAAVDAFENQGINKIIALTHIGFNDSVKFDNDIELAKHVEGIDIIVGGHTHYTLAEPYVSKVHSAPTVIVQANEYAKYLGTLDVTFNAAGEVVLYDGELLSTEKGKTTFAADKEAERLLAPFKTEVESIKTEEIGVDALVKLDASRDEDASGTPSVRHSEMILGNIIADGLLHSARTLTDNYADIAVQNGGGIRTSIDEGPITVGEVLQVLPFGNGLATVTLSGAEVLEVLEHSVSADLREDGGLKENGGFLQIAGMKFTYDSSKKVGERVEEVLIDTEGEFVPLDKAKDYIVATNIFTAKGGDGYQTFEKAFNEGRVSEPGFSDYQNLIDYLKTFEDGVKSEVEGRIVNKALEK